MLLSQSDKALDMKYRFTNVMNYRIRYAESGNATSHVLLVHGLGGSADSWIRNIDAFGRHFHVVAPDLLGFGRSDKPKIRYDMKMFTKFIDRFMDSAAIKTASIVGSSLGGQIAAEFAISHTTRLEKLVIISPAGIPPREFKGTAQLGRYVKMLDAEDLDDVRAALAQMSCDRSSLSEDYVKNVFEYVKMPGTRHAFLSSLQESAKAPRLAHRLKSMKIKTLVLWGKNDSFIPVKYCHPFISGAENFRLLLIEKCGHRPYAERPDVFNRAVIDFLKE